MNHVNKITFQGIIQNDPKAATTPWNKDEVQIMVKSTQDESKFASNCTIFVGVGGKCLDIGRTLRRGDLITLEGKLSLRIKEKADGSKDYIATIKPETVIVHKEMVGGSLEDLPF